MDSVSKSDLHQIIQALQDIQNDCIRAIARGDIDELQVKQMRELLKTADRDIARLITIEDTTQ